MESRTKPVKMIIILAAALALAALAPSNAHMAGIDRKLHLTPRPYPAIHQPGYMTLSPSASIILPKACDRRWEETARIFADKVSQRFGIEFTIRKGKEAAAGDIQALMADTGTVELTSPYPANPLLESYELVVEDHITIRTASSHGLQNGLMSLLQLILPGPDGPAVPRVRIFDAPRFAWRGLMLDPARMFIPPDRIKRYLDIMCELKLNVFHWHLTDDQGFRMESLAYPRLHEVGSDLSVQSPDKNKALDEHGWGRDGRGYYTREEIREIVEFASARHIMVVPEIDLPGHTSAMLAAYPELSCNGKGAPLRKLHGIFPTALCPGKEEVYEFLDALLGEVAELFPGPYIHAGGDEVVGADWLDHPGNRRLMEEYGYETRADLQSHFMLRVNDIIKGHGKTMICWDETVGYLPGDALLQAWRRLDLARVSAESGHDTIVSIIDPHYLNYSPLLHTLKAIYSLDPLPPGLDPGLEGRIIGGEVCVWGRQPNLSEMDECLFPRMIAHAEVMWSPRELRDRSDFLERLGPLRADMESRGIEFRDGWRSTRGVESKAGLIISVQSDP